MVQLSNTVYQIQNGPLSAIIYFHMPNILQTVLDVSPLL